MKVPRRVLAIDNPHLPKDAPIIGLGCSSFSHFFWTEADLAEVGGAAKWGPDSVDREHPRVQEWIRTIHCAIQEYGITLMDTAPWYGHGTSEVVVGWALEELLLKEPDLRASLTVNTKVGRYESDPSRQFNFTFQTTIESVQLSLKRLKCQYIDVLQLHDPEFSPTLSILLEETIPAMMQCRDNGWCKALGLTGYPLEVQHQILVETMKKFGEPVFDQALTYCHYNLHDTSLISRSITENDKSFADFVAEYNIALLAAAPLSMGLLTHQSPPDWHPAPIELQRACATAASRCEHLGVNISSLAIIKALANPRISCTLLGMKNVEQVKFAAMLASRFNGDESKSTDPETIMELILTKKESDVMRELMDPHEGPFADVWKKGLFRWDGSKSGVIFWKQVDGIEAENWQSPPR